jgi:hypothetical protein
MCGAIVAIALSTCAKPRETVRAEGQLVMKPLRALFRGLLLLMPIYLWVVLDPNFAAAQCPNRGTVVDDQVSNAKGKPYQADEITTIVTYGPDGTKRVSVTKSKLFRDSGGRIRVERFYDGTEDPSENIPMDILIDDNCGTSVNSSTCPPHSQNPEMRRAGQSIRPTLVRATSRISSYPEE